MKSLLVICAFLFSVPLYSQVDEKEEILAARKKYANSSYLKYIKPNGLLLNGKNYFQKYPQTGGHQYIDSKTYSSSQLYFDAVEFKNIPINYDVYNQELVTLIYQDNTVRYLILDQRRISKFILNDALFCYIKKENAEGLTEGIYQELFQHHQIRLLVKRKKERSKMAQTSGAKYRYRFSRKDEYYLIGEWGSKNISNKGDILELMPNSEQAQNFLEQNGFKLKENQSSFEREFILLLNEFYTD